MKQRQWQTNMREDIGKWARNAQEGRKGDKGNEREVREERGRKGKRKHRMRDDKEAHRTRRLGGWQLGRVGACVRG